MKIFDIEENDANQRLDKFLKKLFPAATRGLIYKFNRKGKIKVLSPHSNLLPKVDGIGKPLPNPPLTGEGTGKKIKKADGFKKRDNDYKLKLGDKVKIFLDDEDFEILITDLKKENKIKIKDKFDKKDIVYEDDHLLIVNKNSGINVHPGDHKTKEVSLINMIHDYLGNKLNSLTFRPSLIHRIDRDTSGILMIAKKKNILVKLMEDFKDHKKIEKTYYAIVLGKLSKRKGNIKKKLLRIENATNESKVQISEKGKVAITHYKSLKEHIIRTKENILIITEVEIKIETGRMHQIRVHMASLGNPILGDKSYGDKSLNSYFSRNYGLSRQALHAFEIKFFHYGLDKKIKLKAEIKDDIKNFLEDIKNKYE